jgi:hypothetical protein
MQHRLRQRIAGNQRRVDVLAACIRELHEVAVEVELAVEAVAGRIGQLRQIPDRIVNMSEGVAVPIFEAAQPLIGIVREAGLFGVAGLRQSLALFAGSLPDLPHRRVVPALVESLRGDGRATDILIGKGSQMGFYARLPKVSR